jgi:hypothetical protein
MLRDERADGRVLLASGLVRGSASQVCRLKDLVGLVVAVPASTERMIVNLSSIAACLGRCSQIDDAGQFRLRDAERPAVLGGRSGLGSHVSMWLGPPAIQSRMTLLPLSMLRRLATTRPSRVRA